MKLYKLKQWSTFGFIFCVLIGVVAVKAESQESIKDLAVSAGKEVSLEYTLKLEDESVVDSNTGSEPLTFVQGSHAILPVLEDALEDMKIGESKQITVKPEDGYGHIDKNAVQEIEKERIPQGELKIGTVLQGQNADGQNVHASVKEIKEKTVLLDFNHPLAGKTLYFDIKVLDVRETPAS